MMKRILIITIICFGIFSFTGCQSKENSSDFYGSNCTLVNYSDIGDQSALVYFKGICDVCNKTIDYTHKENVKKGQSLTTMGYCGDCQHIFSITIKWQ